jgi:RNA polymerase sigma-54 factor
MASFGLHQTQSLSQTLSPQMQQSLALLQAPAMELRSIIQAELESNPALDEVAEEPESETESETETTFEDQREAEKQAERDEDWRDLFVQSNQSSTPYTAEDAERRQFFFDSQVEPEHLSDHLSRQLSLATNDPDVIGAGDEIIGNIDDEGFLKAGLEEIAAAAMLPFSKVQEALHLIQTFDPVGVAARDLRECLLIQIDRLGKGEDVEAAVVSHHLAELGRKKYQEIARALKVSTERIFEAAHFIATLQPRPGSAFSLENKLHIVQTEISVQKVGEEWVVFLNDDGVPRLRISDQYKDLIGTDGNDPQVREYLKDKIRSGKFLIKCLHLRQQTLFNIATAIVQRQTAFFENGSSHLKPLTMNQIAEAVGVHETTVSRAIANKYALTPWGVFDLKFFFTPGYQTTSGEMLSNTSVKGTIEDLIKRENGQKPLSDQEIVTILSERGIPLARRTVAKYRSELNILPSNLRRART